MKPYWSDDLVTLYHGDCIDVLAGMDTASVDAVVTDPPYALPGGFMGKTWDRYDGGEDAGFAYWLTGLIDGEGHFGIKGQRGGNDCETHVPFFALKMRADERPTLETIRRELGIGQIQDEPNHQPNPLCRWVIQTKADCQRLVDVLDKYGLRAKKRMDYALWREAVCEWTSRPRGNRWHGPTDDTRMRGLKAQMEAGRRFDETPWSGHEFQDWCRLWARECLRVLKPGGHLLAFGGTRTYHRLACAIEDAGFEIRDSLHWITGQGFPKSLDVSKAIDKAAGAERDVIGKMSLPAGNKPGGASYNMSVVGMPADAEITAPATDEAKQWAGWGTALKPAHEPIVLARKPLAGTVAANVVAYGTGGLNVAGCQVGTSRAVPASVSNSRSQIGAVGVGAGAGRNEERGLDPDMGRWPPNILLGHSEGCVPVGTRKVKASTVVNRNNRGDRPKTTSVWSTFADQRTDDQTFGDADGLETVEAWDCTEGCPVAEVDRQSGVRPAGSPLSGREPSRRLGVNGVYGGDAKRTAFAGYDDTGGASRFFPIFRYQAKAGQIERPRTKDDAPHPTVKPVALMGWLVRLVTPPGGVVLDPFAGSGTTAEACILEKIRCMLIEKDESSVRLCRERLRKPMQQGLFTLGELEGRS